jgi:exopolysaccharide biosynthesis polyprenyl glycosylphosphotransferase
MRSAELLPIPLAFPADGIGAPFSPASWRQGVQRRLLGAADLVAIAVSLVIVLTLGSDRSSIVGVIAAPAFLVPLVLVLFKLCGLYDRDELRLAPSTLDEAPVLLQLTGLFALGFTLLQPALPSVSLGSGQIAALWLCSFGAIVSARLVARAVARRVSAVERCLVVGELHEVDRIADKLAASRARASIVACLPVQDVETGGLASPESLRQVVRDLHVHRLIVASTRTDTHAVVELLRMAKLAGVRVSVAPRMLEVVGSGVEFDDVDGMTMLAVRRFGLSRSSRVLKRAFDLVLTSIGFLAVAPVLGLLALCVRLDSTGPIFFRQVRVGRDGKHFRIVKFRSMVVDADARKDELRALNEAGDGLFKIDNDPRVTRVGSFLRRSSLDELPQLLNVLRGEMSLVGPRPLVTDEDAKVVGLDRSRLHLTPGMTGPWQVLGSRVPLQEMVGIDYLYVANWSLWVDLKILLRTVRHVARRGNA